MHTNDGLNQAYSCYKNADSISNNITIKKLRLDQSYACEIIIERKENPQRTQKGCTYNSALHKINILNNPERYAKIHTQSYICEEQNGIKSDFEDHSQSETRRTYKSISSYIWKNLILFSLIYLLFSSIICCIIYKLGHPKFSLFSVLSVSLTIIVYIFHLFTKNEAKVKKHSNSGLLSYCFQILQTLKDDTSTILENCSTCHKLVAKVWYQIKIFPSFIFQYKVILLYLVISICYFIPQIHSQTLYNGNSYIIVNSPTASWNDANDYCEENYLQGHLVAIASGSENTFVRQLKSSGEVWIGLRIVDRYDREWADGSGNDTYTNFETIETDCNQQRCCVSFLSSGSKWFITYCNENKPFFCEFPLSCHGILGSDSDACGTGNCVSHDNCECPNGHYYSDNECKHCREGYYCDSVNIHVCPPGTWSSIDAATIDACTPCPSRHACKNGVKESCIGGTIYPFDENPGHDTCANCTEGNFIHEFDSSITCQLCPLGHYCPGNGQKVRCDGVSFASEEGSTKCTTCEPGSYLTMDNILCLPCTSFEICLDGLNLIYCEDDQYYPGHGIECLECPENAVCKNGEVYTCGSGHYIYFGECIECPLGFYCVGDGTKSRCEGSNYTSTTGNSECLMCPSGYYTLNSGMYCLKCLPSGICTNGIDMILCDTGYYYNVDTKDCIICPLGFYCNYAHKFHCLEGTYADELGMTECRECDAGTFNIYSASPSVSFCEPCPKGTYSGARSLSCTPCPPGTWNNITMSQSIESCINCPPGTFQPNLNATEEYECLPCPMGFFNSEFGSSKCEPCPKGYFSQASATVCTPCPPGSYSDKEESSYCTLCPSGTFNSLYNASSLEHCISCPEGGSSQPGRTSEDSCDDCGLGYFLNGTSCNLCLEGSYSDGTIPNACSKCPKGTYLNYTGGISEVECLSCPLGTIGPYPGLSTCIPCLPGTYMDKEGMEGPCIDCPYGHYSEMEYSQCEVCPPGTIVKEESRECYPCEKGTYSNESLSTSCTICSQGAYTSLIGSTYCNVCPSGTYSEYTRNESPNDCIPCPVGSFSLSAAVSKDHCLPCPLGHFCDEPGLANPKRCRKGTFLPKYSATLYTECIPCPKGTFGTLEGAISILDCESCPYGYYGEVEGAFSSDYCIECPAGTYSNTFRASSISQCEPCLPGSYSTKAGSSCTLCPIGTYNEEFGSDDSTACKLCPSWATTKETGSTNQSDCFSCEIGHYVSTSLNCEPCPSGTYFDPSKEFDLKLLPSLSSCVGCGIGYFQPVLGAIANTTCALCNPGEYSSNPKSEKCVSCGKGYYSTEYGGTSKSSCQECPPGTWGEKEISDSVSNCKLCPPGTHNTQWGGNSSGACKLCPPGTMSQISGSTECIECEECDDYGSSYQVNSKRKISEDIFVYDPKSFETFSIKEYSVLKFTIPFILLTIVITCLVCFGLCQIVYQKSCFALKELDIFFRYRHYVKKKERQVNRPTMQGSLVSIIISIVFILVVSNMFIDLIGKNKIIIETYVLENEIPRNGNFYFEVILEGTHSLCNSSISIAGFSIASTEVTCEQGRFNSQQEYSPIIGCKCSISCLDCKATEINSIIEVQFHGALMTRKIYYSTLSPHFVDSQYYQNNGSISSFGTLFTGNEFAHIISFSLNPVRHLSIPFTASFYDALGMNIPKTERNGYSIELSSRIPGSSKLVDENFGVEEGMTIRFEISKSLGVLITEEKLSHSLISFIVQILTVLSALVSAGTITVQVMEFLIIRRVSLNGIRKLRKNKVAQVTET